MAERAFVDTNVWIYAIDAADPDKRKVARTVLAQADASSLVLSAQVLSEFHVVATRRMTFERDVILGMVERMARLTVVPIDATLVLAAIEGSRSWQISYWDALIIRAAETGGCRRLLTEDLADGRTYGSVIVTNPFA